MSLAGLLLLALLAPAPAAPLPAAPAAPAQAAPAEVHSRLSTSTPKLGEPFIWEIELRHRRAESYALPEPLALPPFELRGKACTRAPLGDDSITTCALTLALYQLGGHDLPALRLEAATPEGPRVLDVPGPRVEAAGVIDAAAATDSLELRPPAAPVALVLPSWRIVWWTLGGLAALLAAWLAWRWWRRRARAAAAPAPPLPADVRFARRLDALEAERLHEQGRGREHFFRLSEAVREYLGALTGLNALDLTSGELLDALAAQPDPRLDLAALRAFSEDADLVKFARAPAGGHECAAGLRYARALLAQTTVPLAPTPTSTATSTSTPTPTPTATSTPTPTATATATATPTPTSSDPSSKWMPPGGGA